MIRRPLGATGIETSALGLGAGPLGDLALEESAVDRLVGTALDLGITLFDTAPSYGASEPRLARALAGRRERVTLVTKGGYGVPGVADWTPGCITAGIDRARARLEADVLDVFLLHSCPLDVLARGDLLEPLHRARREGKVRAVGYSGDGDALAWAVRSAAFDVVECSVNVVDQAGLADVRLAEERGIGVLAKRALANAAWRYDERPDRHDVALYWDRLRALGEAAPPRSSAADVWLRFTAFATGVSAALVGTTRRAHLVALAEALAGGDVDAGWRRGLEVAFQAHAAWGGVI